MSEDIKLFDDSITDEQLENHIRSNTIGPEDFSAISTNERGQEMSSFEKWWKSTMGNWPNGHRGATEKAWDKQQSRIDELEKKLADAREALSGYASQSFWAHYTMMNGLPLDQSYYGDGSKEAAECLKRLEEK